MLYLDYSRKAGEWVPNIHGGNENLEAIDFLRKINELAHQVPGAITVAEESTAFTGVSRPVYLNGLGFTMKWNMGWMHDMLHYFERDPIYRKYHQNDITFSMVYAFTREFRAAHFARRSGLWQAGAARQDAGRRVAAVRECARVSGLHVRRIRARSCCSWAREFGQTVGMEFRGAGGVVAAAIMRFTGNCNDSATALNELYRSEPALYRSGLPLGRVRMDRLP